MAKLVLCKGVELEPNYEHTFDFANATEQGEYFSSKAYKTYDAFLKIKDRNASLFKGIIAKENYDYLKVDESIDEVRQCTYLYWQDDVTSKIYYAFITNSYYVNDGCTIVEYELDVMQTFLFDYQIESAYIAREHQNRMYKDGAIYKPIFNIKPENFNLGNQYYTEKVTKLAKYTDIQGRPLMWVIIVASDKLFNAGADSAGIESHYGILSNMHIYMIPFIAGNEAQTFTYSNNTLTSVPLLIDNYAKDSKVHQMYIMSHIPFENDLTFTFNSTTQKIDITYAGETGHDFFGIAVMSDLVALKFQQPYARKTERAEVKIGELDIKTSVGIVPSTTLSNNISYETKLWTYPFRKIEVQCDNNTMEIKNEYAKSKDVMGIFNFYGTMTQLIYNKNYNQNTSYTNYGLRDSMCLKVINDIPIVTDPYLQYILTKNAQVQTGLAVKGITSAIGVLGAGFGGITGAINPVLATAGVALSVANMAGAVAQENAKQEDLKNTPDEISNQGNDGMFGSLSLNCIPFAYNLSVRDEYLQQAYSYFRLYGYKANRLATPTYNSQGTITSDNMNLKSRYYYNYIKCADINIELAYNRDYHDKIVSIFKAGITFWHYRSDSMNVNTFKPFNYRYENIEVSLLS